MTAFTEEELMTLNQRKPLKNRRDVPPVANPWKWSPMEYAVMSRYTLGMSTKEVAESLCLSEKTVITYSMRAREKITEVTGTGSLNGDSMSMVRACVLLDRYQREGGAPAFKLLVEVSEGQISTRVMP